ncbi:MAG: putative quinol monooxygenase [Pseudomonadota bacterium]
MTDLTIVAHIFANSGDEHLVRAELDKLVPVTKAEEGCLRYDLHSDHEDPLHFMFYETWTSRALWQQHMNTPHLAAYSAATEGKVREFTLHEMQKVDP